MAKDDVWDWSTTPANNTDVGGVGITGANLPSNLDDGMRTLMAQIASFVSYLGITDAGNVWNKNQSLSGAGPTLTLIDTTVSTLSHSIGSFSDDLTLHCDIDNVRATPTIRFRIAGTQLATLRWDGGFLSTGFASDAGAWTSGASYNGDGTAINYAAGSSIFSKAAAAPITVNRNAASGAVVSILRAGTSVGSISVSGSTTAYNTSSDERLKEDLQPLDRDLLDQIAVYDFLWKGSSVRGHGVIAQELFDVIPMAVYRGEATEEDPQPMWSVDYSKLVPLLIACVQDLRLRVAALEA